MELHKSFLTFIDKFNGIGTNHSQLNKNFDEAGGSAQDWLLPLERRFTQLAGQIDELTLREMIDQRL